jgi:hypothetical protein
MKYFLSVFFFVSSLSLVHALEVDEKLTMRVLRLSDTRKTMLVNRGTEDGLAEGDHAKFYVSTGVVARAVIVKVSPSRSVWSIYRLVNADLVVADTVMSLKITPPVKITQDETKMIVQEDTPVRLSSNDPAQLGIPLAEGAEDLPKGMELGANPMSQNDLMSMQAPRSIKDRNIEIWSGLSVSSLGSTTTNDTPAADSFTGADSRTQVSINMEYYFRDEKEWWSRFSPYGFVNIHNRVLSAFQGSKQSESITEFGGGLNYHPWTMPSVVNEFIGFLGFSFGMGQVQSTYEPGAENPGAPAQQATGSSIGYSVGGGFKFYTSKGWGARAILDYYMRNDSMTEETEVGWTRSVSGPRLWVGLGYRW